MRTRRNPKTYLSKEMELVAMAEAVGNEESMKLIEEAMAKKEAADQVNMGELARNDAAISFTSSTGKQYTGIVTFKRPSVLDYMKMGAIKSEVLRKAGVISMQHVDSDIKVMAQILATLKTLIVKRPEWLVNIDAIEDMDLIFHVYEKYEVWENSFRLTV